MMAEKCYKSYKFSVEQVVLMEQLIETGMTETDVAAGFKQIRDIGAKSSSTASAFPSEIEPDSGNAVAVPILTCDRSQASPSSHSVLESSPRSQNRPQASPSSSDVTGFSTPTHNSTRLSLNSTSSTPTTPTRRSPRTSVMNSTKTSDAKLNNLQLNTRGKKRRGAPMQAVASRRGKLATSDSIFVLTNADRNLYSTEVIDLMARSVSEVANEISVFMAKNNYEIKQIADSNPGNLYNSYCLNWFKSPNTAQKQQVCGIYQWYVNELQKVKENLDNNADSVKSNNNVNDSFPTLNLETKAYLNSLFESFISNDNFVPRDFDAVDIAAKASEMTEGASVTPAQVSNVFFQRFYSARENCQAAEVPESIENNGELLTSGSSESKHSKRS